MFLFIFASCNDLSNPNSFNSKKLEGKYKIDVSSIMSEVTNKSFEDDDWASNLGRGLARLMASTVKFEIVFYENNEGLFDLDAGAFNLFADLSDLKNTAKFSYKIEEDSVMYIKYKEDVQYKKVAIIKKLGDSYDYLSLQPINSQKRVTLFLRKQ